MSADFWKENPLQLPNFVASVYEKGAGNFFVVDTETGEILSRTYTMVWADARMGYFVEIVRADADKGTDD